MTPTRTLMAMSITSRDVAARAGVSRTTVSEILNGHGARFTEPTRERVMRAAAELGYQPSIAGRTLARGSSDFILALTPYATFGSQVQDLYERMTVELAEHGLTLVLRVASLDPAALDRMVSALRPAAVSSIAPLSEDHRAVLERHGVPVVDPVSAGFPRPDAAIGRFQTELLLERGHRRIAFAHLTDFREDPFGQGRLDGVRAACREAGTAEPVVVEVPIDAVRAREALASLPVPGTGVVCHNDDVALTLLWACTATGLRVPEDVAIIGMDASALSRASVPTLATVAYDTAAAVREHTRLILETVGRPARRGVAAGTGPAAEAAPASATAHDAAAALSFIDGASI